MGVSEIDNSKKIFYTYIKFFFVVMIDITIKMDYTYSVMKIPSRFTIAVHTLLAIHTFEKTDKTTSEFLAASVNVNPVIIRRTLQSLKAAGMIEVKAGSGGARIAKSLEEITLYDVYRAVDSVDGDLFHFHEHPNPDCPVGKNVHALLDGRLARAQAAMENELRGTTLKNLADELATLR